MNNKFIKRIAAVMLAVVVLSTCAFANDISESSFDGETVTLSFTSTACRISYMVYASTDGNAESTLLAIGQLENPTGNTHEITFDKSRLGTAPWIIIKSGEVGGDAVAKIQIDARTFEVVSTTVCQGTEAYTVGGTTFTGMPVFELSVNFYKSGSITIDNVIARYTDGEEAASKWLNIAELPAISGTAGAAAVVKNIYIAGAPDAFINDNAKTLEVRATFSK